MRGASDIDGLVAHGLDRYRAGDIDGALLAWEQALAVDPDEPRALGYVDYVRQNYDELAGGTSAPMSEMLIPFGLARSDDDDDYEVSITESAEADDSEASGELTMAGPRADRGLPPPAPEPSIDDGWGLDADSEPTWFTGPTHRALGYAVAASAVIEQPSETSGWIELEAEEPRPGGRPPSEGGFGDDERTRDFAQARGALPMSFPIDFTGETSGETTLELGVTPGSDFGTDFTGERTAERGAVKLAPEVLKSLGIEPINERRAGSEDLTTEAWPHAGGFDVAAPGDGAPRAHGLDPATLDLATRAGTLDLTASGLGSVDLPLDGTEPVVELLPPPERFEDQGTADLKGKVPRIGQVDARDDERQSVEIEDLLLPPPRNSTSVVDDDSREELGLHGRALSADEDITARLSIEIDAGASPRESVEDRARRRIAALLDRARVAADAEDHSTAVAAIDLALSEAPDVAAAQKLVHRSRDLILDCYYRFFGSLDRTPVMAAPLSELTRRPLDPRAAFLLSRIDGTLTFEEILDVAGMGRLEACRHLAHLLWRGIISAT